MSKEKTEIEKILAIKLSNASEYVYEALFFAVDQERLKEAILLRLDKEGPSIGNLAGSISIEDFNTYIHMPQVSDVINCYLSYCLLLNIAQTKEKRTILKEDVYTYLLKTIETHYPSLSEEKNHWRYSYAFR